MRLVYVIAEFINTRLFGLRLRTISLIQKKIKCDSIQLILADKEGNWLGKGISGLYQKDSLLNKKFTVTNSNKAKISVRHIMRDKNLPGIRDIGIKLIKVSN